MFSNSSKIALLLLGIAKLALAGTITFSGPITQSTADGTGPAVNNPNLNNIMDGDTYIVTVNFPGSISAPGLYNDPSNTLGFLDTTASVSENAFTSASVSVTADGSFFDISVVGCLSSGSGCGAGNELTSIFQIANTDLNSASASAHFITGLFPPTDLFEDDGVTDIQGDVSSFSNTGGVSATPEPGSIGLIGIGLGALAIVSRRKLAR